LPKRETYQTAKKLRALINREALRLGFDAVAVTSPSAIPQAAARLATFVAEGQHGTMDWMAETLARRGDPQTLWPEGAVHHHAGDQLRARQRPVGRPRRARPGAISVYARNRDYHDIIKGRLKEMAGLLAAAPARR
jgi:epoxyqueuosine reductase